MSAVALGLAVVVLWLVMWVGIVSLIGALGWRPLAHRYPAERWPDEGDGVRLSWQSLRVGASSYNGVIRAAVTADGFYLRPLGPFAFNHAPVWIPWERMERVEAGRFGGVTLVLEEGRQLRLGGRLGRTVREAHAVWSDALGSTHDAAAEAGEELPSWRRTRAR